jgi:UDP-N-acetylmuramate--alanine ligase
MFAEIKSVHFVGIGGTAMASTAAALLEKGFTVTGSDNNVYEPMASFLAGRGIAVMNGYAEANLASKPDLVVIGNAISRGNPEAEYALDHKLRFCSLPDLLREFFIRGKRCVVVAGTHGKTTTTAMLAKILIDTGKEPTVIAGSILREQGSNFVPGRPDLFVIEGCEYRRHFLQLHPSILAITNIELDHTDYYKDLADITDAFRSIARAVPEQGTVVTDTGSSTIVPVLHDLQARIVPYQDVSIPPLRAIGEHNKMNARAAKALAYACDPDLHETDIDKALSEFSGTWRRFEYRGTTETGVVVYDDYAHHPTAIRMTLEAVRAEFPNKRILLAFHPHLYSRTRDLMDAFVPALALADEVVLAPIYAAREAPIEGVTSEALAHRIYSLGTPAQAYVSLEAVLEAIRSRLTAKDAVDMVCITMGAGDIHKVAGALTSEE